MARTQMDLRSFENLALLAADTNKVQRSRTTAAAATVIGGVTCLFLVALASVISGSLVGIVAAVCVAGVIGARAGGFAGLLVGALCGFLATFFAQVISGTIQGIIATVLVGALLAGWVAWMGGYPSRARRRRKSVSHFMPAGDRFRKESAMSW